MERVKFINNYLKNVYGLSDTGTVKFRLVWSEDVLEKRVGVFEDFTPAGIFIRRVEGVREVKKYSYLKDRWILEVYSPEQALSPEIMNGDKYEPLFVFDKKGVYLSPELEPCNYIISRYLEVIGKPRTRRTDEMDRREHEEGIDKEAAKFVEYFEGEDSELMQQFRNQEAVIIHREES